MGKHRYLIALGSNQRHHRFGAPEAVLGAALHALCTAEIKVKRTAKVLQSAPLGPSRRRYANGAALIKTHLQPPELLILLKQIERQFGRRSTGQRWISRVLDLDIILWSGGPWCSPCLTIPHPAFRIRDFVLRPALGIAPDWRDPLTALTLRQLHARNSRRLTRPRPLPR